MVTRLEAGTIAPTRAIASKLAQALEIEISEAETNAQSIPLLHAAVDDEAQDQLLVGARRSFRFNGKPHPIELPSYVVNGPPDQRPFHDRLLSMQEGREAGMSWQTYSRRLSLVATVDSTPTAQSQLERPRRKSVSWNSNYGPHGWHRYVGRFPPHLIRALLNGMAADSDSRVCDPFAGSGTTLVECRLLGIPAVGIEISPLSALIARTKATFPREPQSLRDLALGLDAFFDGCDMWASRSEVSHDDVLARNGNLLEPFANVERWFTPEALLGVSLATEYAATLDGYVRDALLVALSAKMRSIGNVDVDVVRAEYRKEPRRDVDVQRILRRQIDKMAISIEVASKSHGDLIGPVGDISVREGDALSSRLKPGSVTHVITSPPYGVESLSYFRTHLLSFRALAHFLRQDPYETGEGVVGSEYIDSTGVATVEFPRAERSSSYSQFFAGADLDALSSADHRRTAMMMKFFDDMARTGAVLRKWLAPGGQVAFVIGNKKLGEKVIPTADIVCELFAEEGLVLQSSMRHKLKTNNSNSVVPWQERIINDEYVLLFRKGS